MQLYALKSPEYQRFRRVLWSLKDLYEYANGWWHHSLTSNSDLIPKS